MYKYLLFFFLILTTLLACSQDRQKSKYLRWVGDIELNPELDGPDFKLCSKYTAQQYHNFGKGLPYKSEKIAIKERFAQDYKSSDVPKESGLIRIRFVVNCKGETGAYRLMGMDESYNTKDFDSSITDQLMQITKSLSEWKIMSQKGKARDYYQYLIFKIKDGALIEIMP